MSGDPMTMLEKAAEAVGAEKLASRSLQDAENARREAPTLREAVEILEKVNR